MPSDGSHNTLRITREVADIQKGADLSLAAAFRDDNVRKVRALIIGPPGTPYEFGFFEFKVTFPATYPTEAPKVICITTDHGQTRFNPNIYADGKVCLSILGTWHGERGEQWSTAQGLESILISIQSLMSANPYENEPGFENFKGSQASKGSNRDKLAMAYASKIRHETLRFSVLVRLEHVLGLVSKTRDNQNRRPQGLVSQQIVGDAVVKSLQPQTPQPQSFPHNSEDPEFDESGPFDDLCKRRFLWYYDSYIASIHAAIAQHGEAVASGTPFPTTQFEHPGNVMEGTYQYEDLLRRFAAVRAAIDAQTASWATQAMHAATRESPKTHFFQQAFHNCVANLKCRHIPAEISLVDANPCLWQLVLFGRPSTNLDGGVFRIRMAFSLRFPHADQPRVTVETPLFHHRVVKDSGVLCYTAHKPSELASHVEGIIEAIEDEQPAYDPRTLVNLEAAALLWNSGEDGKKIYGRRLRRSAQDSVES